MDWHIHLDKSLPGPLGVVGAWLHRAELALREDVPLQHAHEETANVLHRKLEQHKVTFDGSVASLWAGSVACRVLHIDPDVLQEILKNLELHRQTFSQIHRDRSVNGVPVPPEQLHDMAER